MIEVNGVTDDVEAWPLFLGFFPLRQKCSSYPITNCIQVAYQKMAELLESFKALFMALCADFKGKKRKIIAHAGARFLILE